MKRVLITGMSATGKSTAVNAMAEHGFRAVDTDTDEWAAAAAAGI
jgi:dephospho-CoA kinase